MVPLLPGMKTRDVDTVIQALETRRVGGVPLGVYSAARTVVDCFKFRNKIGLDVVLEAYGELPVGQAIVLPTEDVNIPFLVSAPTMRVPADISETVNVYLAFRAALIAVLAHNRTGNPIRSLLVPGMGTGIGQVPPERAARQMRFAYDTVLGHRSHEAPDARQILRNHRELLT